jgi:hypothetical protein
MAITSSMYSDTRALPPAGAQTDNKELKPIRMSMDTVQGFEALQRCAKMFTASDLVPRRYQGANNLPNVVIALNMAGRMGADPLMVMQHLNVVYGVPSFSAQFLVASVNSSGRYAALRYEWKGKPGSDEWGCRAWTVEKDSVGRPLQERLYGAWVTLAMVKAEGWWDRKDKNGGLCSKWRTMPEQMFMYRSASFWVRTHAPEISMGMRETEEVEDGLIIDATAIPTRELGMRVLPETGEVVDDTEKEPSPAMADSTPSTTSDRRPGEGSVAPPEASAALPSTPTEEQPADVLGDVSPARQASAEMSSWDLLELQLDNVTTVRELKKASVRIAGAPPEERERIRAAYDRNLARLQGAPASDQG